jgi:hypothetical protein
VGWWAGWWWHWPSSPKAACKACSDIDIDSQIRNYLGAFSGVRVRSQLGFKFSAPLSTPMMKLADSSLQGAVWPDEGGAGDDMDP